MAQKIREPVSVNLVFNHKKRVNSVSKIVWKNKIYDIEKQGLHYTFKKGSTLIHVFSVTSEDTNFKLILDTGSLNWTLEEVYDSVSK